MMIKWHPDKNPGNVKKAAEESSVVQQAFECLMDKWERMIYDWFGHAQYLQHRKVIQCFKNYMWTGIDIKKFVGGGGWFKNNTSMMRLWMSPDGVSLCIGKEQIMLDEIALKEQKGPPPFDSIPFDEITDLVRGRKTELLAKKGKKNKEDLYFSVLAGDKTINLEADSPDVADFLSTRMTLLIIDVKKDEDWLDRHYNPPPPPPPR